MCVYAVCLVGSELSDDSKVAIIVASGIAILLVVVLWIVVIMVYMIRLTKKKSPKLVNLIPQYSEEDDNDETDPLLPSQEETDKRGNCFVSPKSFFDYELFYQVNLLIPHMPVRMLGFSFRQKPYWII